MIRTYEMPREQWNKLPKMKFHNVGLDFSIDVAVVKRFPSGSIKVLVESGSSPDSVTYQVKIAKPYNGTLYIRESGSPLNSYYHRG